MPGRGRLGLRSGITQRAFQISRGQGGPAKCRSCAGERALLRARRAHGRRQDHNRFPDGAPVRSNRGNSISKWTRHPITSPAERAAEGGRIFPRSRSCSPAPCGENIVYGNDGIRELFGTAVRRACWRNPICPGLLSRFPEGLDTKISVGGNSISLGQKQLIAFMRATLRKPELLILDEATANIDTVTEQLLEEILEQLASGNHEGDHRPSAEYN